jgi:membrane-anchored protein YejM (alkaline phosphatase superfamily)
MPRLTALGAQSSVFANHWSGGNSSRAGLFALFYGLPSTYLDAFYGVQQPPVLMERLRALGYEPVLRAAPGFGAPTDLDRTAFAGIPNLPGQRNDIGEVARNRAVTDEWLGWLAHRDASRPFFGFLYYDPPMGEMPADATETLPMDGRFTTSARARDAWRRYRLAARVADGELGRVVDSLGQAHVLEDTVLIVLSDHGYEFDDTGLGTVGHASDYSASQVRATMVVRWPGRPPRTWHHRTSHYDVPVTLLEDALGCTGDPQDYALGRNLYAGRDWDWIIAGSYNSHAILQPDRVIVSHAGGFVELLGADYRPLPGAAPDARVVAEAMSAMRRFYR